MIKNHNCKFSPRLNLNVYFNKFFTHPIERISNFLHWSWICNNDMSISSLTFNEILKNLQILWNTTRNIRWVRWGWWNKTFCCSSRFLSSPPEWTRFHSVFFNTFLEYMWNINNFFFCRHTLFPCALKLNWLAADFFYIENWWFCWSWRWRWRRDIFWFTLLKANRYQSSEDVYKMLNDQLDKKNRFVRT